MEELPLTIEDYSNTHAKMEIFLRVKGRLPDQEGDGVDKDLAREFLDMCHDGRLDEKYHYLMPLAFHIFGGGS